MISDLREDEIEAAIALWRACALTRPWNDPHADIRLALATESSTILAARDEGGALIATAMVGVDGHRGYVYYLAVADRRRRSGLGRDMMAACEAWVAARGHAKLQLMVRADNLAAAGFYEAIGYRRGDSVLFEKWFDGRR